MSGNTNEYVAIDNHQNPFDSDNSSSTIFEEPELRLVEPSDDKHGPFDTFHEHHNSSDEEKGKHADDDDDDDDDDFNDPIRFGSSSSGSTNPPPDYQYDKYTTSAINPSLYLDDYGNRYENVDFDSKLYTSKLKFKGNRLVYFTSAFVSLFVSLFGYEQGVCSGIITFVTFQKYFNNPNATHIGLVISILEIGAMISSLLVAKISDKFGRKRTILLGTFIFMIGGTFQSFAVNLFVFAVGRVISGFGVGILSTIVPSYQCEISPSEERGKLVCGEFTGNICGYSLSVWVDYFCYFIQNIGDSRSDPHSFTANLSWRLPLFIQVVIAFVLFLGGFFIVESPRWLLDVDMDQQGFHVLSLLYDSAPDDDKPRKEFFMIKNSILTERINTPKYERSWKHMFKKHYTRVFIGCSALAFAQFNGINIISYYAPMVFEQAGFNDSNALLMTGINSLVYLFCTILPWFLVDIWGRKPILISGGTLMAICLGLIAVFMALDKSYTPSLVALLVIIYNGGFGYSWGPIGFLLPPEVYPLSVRSKGVSLSTATNWLANYIVGQLTPILQEDIKWKMYLFPMGSCILSVVVVIFFYPETKGVELEDMDRLFDEFYGKTPHEKYNPVDTSEPRHDDSWNEELELNEFDYEHEDNQRRTVL